MTKVIPVLPFAVLEILSSATFRANQSFHRQKSAMKLTFPGSNRITVWEASDVETSSSRMCVCVIYGDRSCAGTGCGADRSTASSTSGSPGFARCALRLGRWISALEWTALRVGSGILRSSSAPPREMGCRTLGSGAQGIHLGPGVLAVVTDATLRNPKHISIRPDLGIRPYLHLGPKKELLFLR